MVRAVKLTSTSKFAEECNYLDKRRMATKEKERYDEGGYATYRSWLSGDGKVGSGAGRRVLYQMVGEEYCPGCGSPAAVLRSMEDTYTMRDEKRTLLGKEYQRFDCAFVSSCMFVVLWVEVSLLTGLVDVDKLALKNPLLLSGGGK